jgi:polyisoprenoid-binding protein YceI
MEIRARLQRVSQGVASLCIAALALIWLGGARPLPAEEGTSVGTSPPGRIEFVGRNAVATANGVFHVWRIAESRIDPVNLAESWALVEVDLSSVDTGNERRDDHLRDPDFFEVETFPTARVRVHTARPAGESEAGHPVFQARFDIDLHGVKKTLEGELELVGSDPLAFEGWLVIDRMDFGVGSPHSRWNPFSIREEIPVRFRVEP